LCTLFASSAAYTLSRNRSKLNRFLYIFIVLGIAMPLTMLR
jgi:raffinose/stachyose/melibiose transport system permease protein